MAKKLYRSRKDRKIWGICGGLAEYFDVDAVIVRIIFVASIFLGILGIWGHLIMWFMVPEES